eukprot:6188359-Pleurochrysis_carterae.AAC.2
MLGDTEQPVQLRTRCGSRAGTCGGAMSASLAGTLRGAVPFEAKKDELLTLGSHGPRKTRTDRGRPSGRGAGGRGRSGGAGYASLLSTFAVGVDGVSVTDAEAGEAVVDINEINGGELERYTDLLKGGSNNTGDLAGLGLTEQDSKPRSTGAQVNRSMLHPDHVMARPAASELNRQKKPATTQSDDFDDAHLQEIRRAWVEEQESRFFAELDGSEDGGAKTSLCSRPGEASTASSDSFTASSRFEGCRRGQVFKLGERGLGYYKDEPPEVRSRVVMDPDGGLVISDQPGETASVSTDAREMALLDTDAIEIDDNAVNLLNVLGPTEPAAQLTPAKVPGKSHISVKQQELQNCRPTAAAYSENDAGGSTRTLSGTQQAAAAPRARPAVAAPVVEFGSMNGASPLLSFAWDLTKHTITS